jgi:hypothetical protein
MNSRGIVKRNGAKNCMPGETKTENGKRVAWNWHKAGVARYIRMSFASSDSGVNELRTMLYSRSRLACVHVSYLNMFL